MSKRGSKVKSKQVQRDEMEEGEEEEQYFPPGDESDEEATRQYLASIQPVQSQAPPFAAAMASYSARKPSSSDDAGPKTGVKRKESRQREKVSRPRFDRKPAAFPPQPPQNAEREFQQYKQATIKHLEQFSRRVPKQAEEGIKASFPATKTAVPLPVLTPIDERGEQNLKAEKSRVKQELDKIIKRLSFETFIGTPVLHLDPETNRYVDVKPTVLWNRQALKYLLDDRDKEYVKHFMENHALIWDMGPEVEPVRKILREHQDVASVSTNEFSQTFIEEKIKTLKSKYGDIMNILRTAPRLARSESASKKLYLKLLGLTGAGNFASYAENIVNKLYTFFGYAPINELEKSIADIIMLNMAIMMLIVLFPESVVTLLPVLRILKDFSSAFLGTVFTMLYSERVSLFVGDFIDIFYRAAKKITTVTTTIAKNVGRELNIIRQNINEIIVMMSEVDKPEQEQVEVAGRVLTEIMKKDEMYDVESEEAMEYFEEDEERAAEDEEETEGDLPDFMRKKGKGGKRRTKKAKKSRRSIKKRRNTRKR
jgi:hypothetical protein